MLIRCIVDIKSKIRTLTTINRRSIIADNAYHQLSNKTDTNGTECMNPVEDGVELMRILDAIYESARLRREVTLYKQQFERRNTNETKC